MWDVLEDLLNDGDHAKHAQFKFKLERDPATGNRIYHELWTGDWWRRQQANLGPKKNVLAIIPYMDETPVTLNGRNMHPVYVSLGNLHTSFRYSPNSFEKNLKLSTSEIRPQENGCLGSCPTSRCALLLETRRTFKSTSALSWGLVWDFFSSNSLTIPKNQGTSRLATEVKFGNICFNLDWYKWMWQVAELNVFQEFPSSSQTKKIWVFASRHSMHRGKRAGLATYVTCVFQTTQTLLKLEHKGHWVIGRRCETMLLSFCFHIHDTFASCLHSKTATVFAKYRKRSAKTGQFILNGIHCLICLASIHARTRAVACMRAITALSSAS